MDLNKLPLFAALTRKMQWLNERQRVIAQNIANIDTPGYTSHELKPLSFSELIGGSGAGKLAPVATAPAHLQGTIPVKAFREQKQQHVFESSPTGNAVVVEDEMVKLAETQIDYNTTANLYKKQIDMLKLVLGKK